MHIGCDRLAMVQIGGEQRRVVCADSCDIGADIGEQPAADGSRKATTKLNNAKACQ
jgi:hypothetical protein